MAFAILALVSTLVSASLLAVRETKGYRALWIVTTGLAAIGSAAAFVIEQPPSETSATALTFGIALSLSLAGVVVTIGPPRFGRAATLILASVLCALCVAPGYLLGCVFADLLPVNGCFF